jgi:hypothetical protein
VLIIVATYMNNNSRIYLYIKILMYEPAFYINAAAVAAVAEPAAAVTGVAVTMLLLLLTAVCARS